MSNTPLAAERRFDALLSAYAPPRGVADELIAPDGTLRAVWRPLLELLRSQAPEDLAGRFARGDQYLHDAGVYFRQYTGTGSNERDWPLSHVPVILGAEEWSGLAAGVAQRAELLERVMADLYGAGRLVSGGLLPAELVARNPEWLRPIVGIRPEGGHFLHFVAMELGRSPDGSWFVLGDRTQAPSGAGFALENRVATGRVFSDLLPGAGVERIAGFFRSFRDALTGLRPTPDSKVAILTPGQLTDTYFEHAYIARYLGLTLLEAADLQVTDGKLTMQTIAGRAPVGVLWRRLDSRSADPLELDEDSALGTPGLVSALRAGGLAMVNCLGSGVLENRALMAFLPRICETLMGSPLILPNIATWWCGQDAERAYVRDNLHRMMIGPALSTRLPFDPDALTALGGRFRDSAHGPVGDWLEADGANLVGQEAVTLSTTPAMIDGQLVPRPMVLRVFAARTPEGWTVMPGGYARIGRTEDPTALAMQNGGSVADVWVTGGQPVIHESLVAQAPGPFVRRDTGSLPARSADNLFWLGRYVERAEGAVRLLRAYHLRLEEAGFRQTELTDHLAGFLAARGLDVADPVPGALQEMFELSKSCAGKVRDRFSTDGWAALGDLALTATRLSATARPGDDAARAMGVLLRKLAGFSGLVHENMFRFTGWRFLTMGRALERAQDMAGVLAAFADEMTPQGGFEIAVEAGDSVMTHRRRYAVETNRNTVIDLIALDEGNPRGMIFQLDVLRREEAEIAAHRHATRRSDTARAILKLHTELAIASPEAITTARLWDMRAEIGQISELLAADYLG
ncbi:hypothetical protein HKCCE3408_06310 [Rhodobacterales bacterium HKCCE3408]|nr:hypothetical protein [Rhodobacterales bacterium HKCCE3408]